MTITNIPATNFPYSTQQMSDNVHWLLYSFGIMTSSRPSRIVSVVEGNTMRLVVQPYDEEQPHRHILALLNDDDGRQLATYVCLHGGAAAALTHHAATATEREERIVPCSVSQRVAYSLTAVQSTLPRTFRENPYEGLQNVVHIPAELWC